MMKFWWFQRRIERWRFLLKVVVWVSKFAKHHTHTHNRQWEQKSQHQSGLSRCEHGSTSYHIAHTASVSSLRQYVCDAITKWTLSLTVLNEQAHQCIVKKWQVVRLNWLEMMLLRPFSTSPGLYTRYAVAEANVDKLVNWTVQWWYSWGQPVSLSLFLLIYDGVWFLYFLITESARADFWTEGRKLMPKEKENCQTQVEHMWIIQQFHYAYILQMIRSTWFHSNYFTKRYNYASL